MRYVYSCLIFALWLLWPLAAAPQETGDEDRGYLVGLLESSLGGDGRTVRIDGFAGALSSRATIERITIADAEGIWLTLEDVAMQWNRSALLRAAIDIEELRAARIDLTRLPVAAPNDLPAPEAAPFSLPDLPASVSVAQLQIDTVALGAPVLGEAVTLSVSGAATLADGAGRADIAAARTDGQQARFALLAAYANDSRALTLDLALTEAAGGLVSGLLNVPDRPSVNLRVAGDGALSDFNATLDLRTDDAPRLAGALSLQSEANGPTAFDADLQGDVTAIVLAEYRAFFGPDVALVARGRTETDGALTLDTFDLSARALRLSGEAALNSDSWPTRLDISGEIADPAGIPVLLPGGGGDTRIDRARLTVTYDATDSDALVARIDATGVDRADLSARDLLLRFDGQLRGDVGTRGDVNGRLALVADGLTLSDPALARAVGPALQGQLDIAFTETQPLALSNLSLAGADWDITGNARIDSFDDAFETTFDTTLAANDLSAFADLTNLPLAGAVTLQAAGTAALGGFFDVTVAGQTRALAIGIPQADALLTGQTSLELRARRDTEGTVLDRFTLGNDALDLSATATLQTGAATARFNLALADMDKVVPGLQGALTVDGTATQEDEIWSLNMGLVGPLGAVANATAEVAPDTVAASLTATVTDLSDLVPQINGPVRVTATANQATGAWQFESAMQAPSDASATVSGLFDGSALSARYDIAVPALAAYVPNVPGGASVTGDLRQTPNGWAFDSQIGGPYAATGTVSGTFENALLTARYNLAIPDVAPLAPGLRGRLGVQGTVDQTARGWQVASDIAGPYRSMGRVTGSFEDGIAAAQYTLNMPSIAPLVPGLSGGVSVDGSLRQAGSAYDVNARIAGPSGTTATATGQVQTDGTLALATQGQLQLGLANPFIAPRSVIGTAQFDLDVTGPPALSSVSGQITTQGARVATPTLPVSISDLSGAVRLGAGQAALDFTAAIAEGGSVRVQGPITLSGGYPAQLGIALDAVNSQDPQLYTSTLGGQIDIRGALAGGARISGALNIGETTVQIPSSGISTFGSVPDITHIGDTRPVMRTRERAGLTQTAAATQTAGPDYPIDLLVRAPSRIFIRGRGIDAELGGQVRLSGTTSDTLSVGQFDLIRGRIDILAQRFTLDEGRVTLQGRFDPFLRLVAQTNTSAGTARIVVEGPADDPEVRFESTPDAPQDQVLAQIFFGRDISQLSAFQALQLASAVASLAGSGGEGIVSRLRGSFGLDDLDVTSDTEGNTAVRAGRYLSENVYTDVTVGGADGPEVSLNLDLTPNITVRGSVGADANTGIGIFIEKDY